MHHAFPTHDLWTPEGQRNVRQRVGEVSSVASAGAIRFQQWADGLQSRLFAPQAANMTGNKSNGGRGAAPRRNYGRRMARKRRMNTYKEVKKLRAMLTPLFREVVQGAQKHIDWGPNLQGINDLYFLDKAWIERIQAKMYTDGRTFTPSGISQDVALKKNFSVISAIAKFSIVNNCDHAVTLTFQEYTPRGYQSESLESVWTRDLTRNNPNGNTSGQLQHNHTVYTVHERPFKSTNVEVMTKFRPGKSFTVVMQPGDNYVYYLRNRPFYFSEEKWNYQIGATDSTQGWYTNHCVVFGHGELITSSASTFVGPGSGRVEMQKHIRAVYRMPIPSNPKQTYEWKEEAHQGPSGAEYTMDVQEEKEEYSEHT